jgi:hypothetical protein
VRFTAASAPARAQSAWVRSAARSAERPEVATALWLQRSVGNRRTCALLRKVRAAHPAPMSTRRGEFPQITSAHPGGGLDQAAWKKAVDDAKTALAAGDAEAATGLYTKLYQDLATTAGATGLKDVGGALPVNVAQADNKGYAPGLNLVLAKGGGKGGTTAFVDDAGNFGVRLDAKATRPRVAIRLFSDSFTADKARSLGLLRHEMLHAHHHEQALAAPKAGKRRAGSPAPSAVDTILVSEITGGGRSNTELLAYVEGFMTTFHLLPAPQPNDAVFLELLGALDTGSVEPWSNAHEDVRDEGLGRLREYYCNTLDTAHRDAFDAWVAAQVAQVAKDAEALKANSDKAAIAKAKRHVELMFEHFVLGLKEVGGGTCSAPAKAKRAARAGH